MYNTCLPSKSATNSYLSTPTSQSKALQQCHLIHRDSAVPRTPTSFFPVANAGLVLFPSESSSLSPRASRNLMSFPRTTGSRSTSPFPPFQGIPPIAKHLGSVFVKKRLGAQTVASTPTPATCSRGSKPAIHVAGTETLTGKMRFRFWSFLSARSVAEWDESGEQ